MSRTATTISKATRTIENRKARHLRKQGLWERVHISLHNRLTPDLQLWENASEPKESLCSKPELVLIEEETALSIAIKQWLAGKDVNFGVAA